MVLGDIGEAGHAESGFEAYVSKTGTTRKVGGGGMWPRSKSQAGSLLQDEEERVDTPTHMQQLSKLQEQHRVQMSTLQYLLSKIKYQSTIHNIFKQ